MQPMRLLRIPQPFDHPDFLYELKLDGFRCLAIVQDGGCQLMSRNGHVFGRWPSLQKAIAPPVQCRSAIIDGEIACFADDGRTDFYALMFGRRTPYFSAFDLLERDGCDLRALPLLERKRQLRAILPIADWRIRFVDHIVGRGCDLFQLACDQDLEGIVAKWAHGQYQSGEATSWLKIKNPDYSQMEGRHELFESRRGLFEGREGHRHRSLMLSLV